MKKTIAGMILLISLVSCEDDEIVTQKEHETKTKTITEASNCKKASDESDSIKVSPVQGRDPGIEIDPGTSLDPGEVGPVVTTPPK